MKRCERLMTLLLSGGRFAGRRFGPGVTHAQDSTVAEVDYSPNPEQCNQAPRTIEEVEALLASATPSPTIDMSAPEGFALPAGEEAPSEVRGGIVETIVQIFACANGGDQLASYGGMTDALFETLLVSGAFGDDPIANFSGTPEALPEEVQSQLLDTREFTRL